MVLAHGNSFFQFIPSDEKTIWKQFVIPIMRDTDKRLQDMLSRVPGYLSLSVDGVTVEKQSCLLYTVSR